MTGYKRKTILSMRRTCVGECCHTTKVTRIGDGWNIRIFVDDVLNQEARVYRQEDIRHEIHSMLRMEDKCGNISGMAGRSRDRYWEKTT